MRHLPYWLCDWDIDRCIDPWVPPSQLWRLPYPIAKFLGYRPNGAPHVCSPMKWLWCFVGAFSGIALIEGVFRASPLIEGHHPPVIIASFGAAAILEYNAIEVSVAQPRAFVGGHIITSVLGVAIAKLFLLLPPERFHDLQWLAGALAVGLSSALMAITNTTHPPGGAVALIASTQPAIIDLGWYFVPLTLLGVALMLGSAVIINNIQRRFPVYWWTPKDLSKISRWAVASEHDVEQAQIVKNPAFGARAESMASEDSGDIKSGGGTNTSMKHPKEDDFTYMTEAMIIPSGTAMTALERSVLESMRMRLAVVDAAHQANSIQVMGAEVADLDLDTKRLALHSSDGESTLRKADSHESHDTM